MDVYVVARGSMPEVGQGVGVSLFCEVCQTEQIVPVGGFFVREGSHEVIYGPVKIPNLPSGVTPVK